MNEKEVLELVLDQIGALRIPLREEALRQDILVIRMNLEALRNAVAAEMEKQEPQAEGGTEDVQG